MATITIAARIIALTAAAEGLRVEATAAEAKAKALRAEADEAVRAFWAKADTASFKIEDTEVFAPQLLAATTAEKAAKEAWSTLAAVEEALRPKADMAAITFAEAAVAWAAVLTTPPEKRAEAEAAAREASYKARKFMSRGGGNPYGRGGFGG